MTLAGAVSALQTKALALSTVAVKSAGGPVENADPCPFFVAYLLSGSGETQTAKQAQNIYTIKANFYFSRANLSKAYGDLNAAAPEYLRDLEGDPTLGGAVATTIKPSFETMDDEWGSMPVVVLSFSVPVKLLETPG